MFLTNALTGWIPPEEPKQHLMWAELEEERDAADRVKQEAPILVILGNPPYNGFAGMAVDEERTLTDAYRETVRAPKPQGQGLNDLYVRFYRMAERKIVDSGEGIVCFISNYSWLDGLSFTGMRERYLEVFDRIWIDCLNGDKYKTGKLTPDGEPDPSIFSTEQNREGIQVGTAIGLLVRKQKHAPVQAVQFRHFWGTEKRAALAEMAHDKMDGRFVEMVPVSSLGLPMVPVSVGRGYLTWPLLPEVFPANFPGVQTKRDEVVVDLDRDALVERIEQYFDVSVSDAQIARVVPRAMVKTARFDPVDTRQTLLRRGLRRDYFVRYYYRPFDLRWIYWESETRLLGEKSPAYFPQAFAGNCWLSAGQRNRMEVFYQPQVTGVLADHHLVESNVQMVPLMVMNKSEDPSLFGGRPEGSAQPNLSDLAVAYVSSVRSIQRAPFFHAVAVLHAQCYSRENAGALRQDWPRIPLPARGAVLEASAALGEELARLLDPETAAPGVSAGTIRPELKGLGLLSRSDGKQVNPKAGDLDVTAGWGHAGKGGVTMPARGRVVERGYGKEEAGGLDAAGAGWRALLGETTRDIYLNETVYWKNVPERVWEYTLGGYQVLKKWLSYRELELLGRPLKPEEARYVTEVVRRIAAILLLGPALDANYAAVKADTWPWPGGKG